MIKSTMAALLLIGVRAASLTVLTPGETNDAIILDKEPEPSLINNMLALEMNLVEAIDIDTEAVDGAADSPVEFEEPETAEDGELIMTMRKFLTELDDVPEAEVANEQPDDLDYAQEGTASEESGTNFFGVGSFFCGLFLIPFSLWLLWVNERKLVTFSKVLNQARSEIKEIHPDKPQDEMDYRLVHAVGSTYN